MQSNSLCHVISSRLLIVPRCLDHFDVCILLPQWHARLEKALNPHSAIYRRRLSQAVLRFSPELDIHAARRDVRGVSVRATEVSCAAGWRAGWLSHGRFGRLLILGFQLVGLFVAFSNAANDGINLGSLWRGIGSSIPVRR
jgi:hypothetical protein